MMMTINWVPYESPPARRAKHHAASSTRCCFPLVDSRCYYVLCRTRVSAPADDVVLPRHVRIAYFNARGKKERLRPANQIKWQITYFFFLIPWYVSCAPTTRTRTLQISLKVWPWTSQERRPGLQYWVWPPGCILELFACMKNRTHIAQHGRC